MRAASAVVLAVALVALVGATSVGASTTYVVTNTNASGPGSLADAVAAANANPGADTITFAVTGTITLNRELDALDDLTIAGPGARDLTVSGGGRVRVLYVGSGVTLAISGLTVADASSDFYGGGIANFGGDVRISDSALVDNQAPYPWVGGAIFSTGGTLDVERSTLSGNSTGGHGGALYLDSGSATIKNSTLVGNQSGIDGGAIFSGGLLTLDNATLVGNNSGRFGGALYTAGGTTTLENTLIASNTAATSGANCTGTSLIVDGGGNLQYPGFDCGLFESADPLLDPAGLANNGGPTDTIALTASSPALDAALAATCPATDQRGVARPQGSGCDIGAFELVQRPTTADQCKNGGWQAYGVFKNQGDCVSYVATRGKNGPAG